MKKSYIIILINLFVLLFIFVTTDYIYGLNKYNKIKSEMYSGTQEKVNFFKQLDIKYKVKGYSYFNKIIHFSRYWNKGACINDERSLKGNPALKPKGGGIIVFGCSFAYGAFLELNETFSYQLSKLTGRSVYNRAFSSCGFGHMLWQTKQNEFYNLFPYAEPEYALYIYIPDHLIRSCHYKNGVSQYNSDSYYLSYELKNGKLVETHPVKIFLNRFAMFHYFTMDKVCTGSGRFGMFKDDDSNFEFIKQHFIETKKELNKRYPNLKFIIIKYPYNYFPEINYKGDYEEPNMNSYNSDRWKELEKEGFIIFELNQKNVKIDVNDDKYRLPDGHPNKKAWEVLTPIIIKQLNL